MKRNTELRQLFHNSRFAVGLGCAPCPERQLCGGEHTPGLFDCMAKCCDDPQSCEYVCKKDITSFVEYFTSVGGYDFEDIDRLQPLAFPVLPYCIPLINNSSSRIIPLDVPAAAIQLRFLFDHSNGLIRFRSKAELREHFGIAQGAKIVITGVSGDGPLEDYWYLGKYRDLAAQLVALDLDLVTSPNYSLFLDSPRFDNLYNMKRIAITWNDLYSKGIPTSLHVNARTNRDWDRWVEFITEREEVQSISFEFATGASFAERGRWHLSMLVELAERVGRPLQLVLRGGYKYLPKLFKAYPNLIYLDTASFIKTVKRRSLLLNKDESYEWLSVASPDMKIIDDLLLENVDKYAVLIGQKMSHREVISELP